MKDTITKQLYNKYAKRIDTCKHHLERATACVAGIGKMPNASSLGVSQLTETVLKGFQECSSVKANLEAQEAARMTRVSNDREVARQKQALERARTRAGAPKAKARGKAKVKAIADSNRAPLRRLALTTDPDVPLPLADGPLE